MRRCRAPDQQTPDLSPVIQEIVSRDDWSANQWLVLVVTGNGKRVAESYEGSRTGAPRLVVEYTDPCLGDAGCEDAPVCHAPPGIEVGIASDADDVEERASGSIYPDSSDLEMAFDKDTQAVGLRFGPLDIPKGAKIQHAYVQFQVDETTSGAASRRCRSLRGLVWMICADARFAMLNLGDEALSGMKPCLG